MAFKRSGVRLPLAPTNKIKGLSRAIAFVSNQLATKLRERLISVSSTSNARSQARSGLLPDGRSPARLVRTERRARDQMGGARHAHRSSASNKCCSWAAAGDRTRRTFLGIHGRDKVRLRRLLGS